MSTEKNLEIKFYKILLLTSVVIISALSLYTFIYIPKMNFQNENKEDSGAEILAQNMSFLKPFELQSEGYNLSSELTVEDETGQIKTFRDLLADNESILVYRFAETHCDLCIEQHLSIFKNLSSKINPGKLVLLSTYTNTKKVKIFRQTNKLNFRIFNVMSDIGIPLEKLNNPYFFIVDKDLKCHHFYAAIKENPELTTSCIKILLRHGNNTSKSSQ